MVESDECTLCMVSVCVTVGFERVVHSRIRWCGWVDVHVHVVVNVENHVWSSSPRLSAADETRDDECSVLVASETLLG